MPLLVPIVGGISYLFLKRKAYYLSVKIFLIYYSLIFLREIFAGNLELISLFQLSIMSTWVSIIFISFNIIGITIANIFYNCFILEVGNE